MAPERVIELTIFADGEIVKDTDILNPYFAELGETGHKLEDAVQSHLEQRGLTPTRRFDSDRGFYDVSVKEQKEVAIPDLETSIGGKSFKVVFRYAPEVGGRRRRNRRTKKKTLKRRRRTTRK